MTTVDLRRAEAARHDDVYDWAGRLVRELVITRYTADVEVLDVGAGHGKYRLLLHEYDAVDACEVWEQTVDQADLWSLYRDVYLQDVYDLVRQQWWQTARYDVVVMGDVLEHMTRERAQLTLRAIYPRCDDVIVVVPYDYPQDEEDGNVYQRHLQDDLTPELMAAAYPELRLIALETRDLRPFKGLYRRSVSE